MKKSKFPSPLKWHGGKSYLATQIVKLMPPHTHYVEPYAGGLSVLLNKSPDGISEVVNDMDGELMNFWKVLQSKDKFDEFERRLSVTPFSQAEWELAQKNIGVGPDLDRAVTFFINCRMSMAGRMSCFTPLTKSRTRGGKNADVNAWLNAVEGLREVHERLRRVVVLNDDAIAVIKREDSAHTLFYLDPPYLPETRVCTDVYQHEMGRDKHEELLNVIKNLKGKALISGYPNELYDNILKEWRTVTFDTPNNAASGDKKRRMSETIWMNF